jgi:threonine dehydratase
MSSLPAKLSSSSSLRPFQADDTEAARDRKLASLVKKILRSAAIIYEVAKETPLSPMPLLSARLDNTVLIKREDLQPIFSFKLRGAYNKMSLLSDEQKRRGVIAASAGNHAQGVALSAKTMGIDCTIVMPIVTPPIKSNAVGALGAKVVLRGDNFDEAVVVTKELCESQG